MATLFSNVYLGQYKFGWGAGGWVTPAEGQDVLKPVISLQKTGSRRLPRAHLVGSTLVFSASFRLFLLKNKLFLWLKRKDYRIVSAATDSVIGHFGCSHRVTP